MELTVDERFPECLIGHAGPLAVCVWRGAPTLPALEAFGRCEEQLLEAHPRISSLVVVREHKGRAARPDPVVEALEVRLADVLSPRTVGAAFVVEARGLAGAIAHGARAKLIPHLSAPNEAFPRVADALQWLARLPGQHPELYAAPELACDLELLGRGDRDA
ncbi:MAG: hypothetical protein QM704_05180 [Anaeromyxobacteraceae bacterium]